MEPVVTELALRVLPFADARLIVEFGMPVPPESSKATVYVPTPPSTRLGGPVTVSVVPVTFTGTVCGFVAEFEVKVAVTVIVRF